MCLKVFVCCRQKDVVRGELSRYHNCSASMGIQYLIVRLDLYSRNLHLGGPSGAIRTRGFLNPNQEPYQLGHTRI